MVPWHGRLSADDQRELEGHVQVFLAEKRFEAEAGLEITDEVRVTIAGHACLLLMYRPTDYFPTVRGVLVRASEYVTETARPLWKVPGGMAIVDEEEFLGEAGHDGVIVLAWDEVAALTAEEDESINVVVHEFAHELDREDGELNGAPELATKSQRAEWARVCQVEFEKLRKGNASRGALDSYGAEDPAEFFAVATEAFFERPERLRRRHPELYDQLRGFYRLDTAALMDRAGTSARVPTPRKKG